MPTPMTVNGSHRRGRRGVNRFVAVALVIALCLLAITPSATAAEQNVRVIVNGSVLENAAGQIVSGRTLVPLRSIFEALGASVAWSGDEQSVSAQLGQRTVKIFIDASKGYVNGVLTDLDVPPMLIDNHTYVPVRFVSEALGALVEWDGGSQTVFVTSQQVAPTVRAPSEGDVESAAQLGVKATVTVLGTSGLGSGFHVGNGRVVTNYHVIEGEGGLSVKTQDGVEHQVDGVLAYDSQRDLAVLLVSDLQLPALALAGDGSVHLGQSVVAVGSPQGLAGTVSVGIVSTTNRVLNGQSFIQTTAALSPGNSGGPLLDLNGRVVGINAATLAAENTQNVNFAIPVSALRELLSTIDESTEAVPLSALPGLRLPVELLAAQLQAAIDGSLFTSADVYWDDSGQEALFYLTTDSEGYSAILGELNSGALAQADLEDLLNAIAVWVQVSEEAPVYGALWFWQVYDSYPQAFADQGYDVSQLDNGQWSVNELVVSITMDEDGAPHYDWWPNP